jgi:hypothetical protein
VFALDIERVTRTDEEPWPLLGQGAEAEAM